MKKALCVLLLGLIFLTSCVSTSKSIYNAYTVGSGEALTKPHEDSQMVSDTAESSGTSEDTDKGEGPGADSGALQLIIPGEPVLISEALAYYSVNSTNPYGPTSDSYDGLSVYTAKKSFGTVNGSGALGVISDNGGSIVIPGRATGGISGFTFDKAGGPVMFTAIDPKTKIDYTGTCETETGENGDQCGIWSWKEDSEVNFAGDYIFDNITILHRTPSTKMQLNVLSGARLVIGKNAKIERMKISALAPKVTTSVNVEEGGYLYLHRLGFSSYIGEGVIVLCSSVDKDSITADVFRGFRGTVVDENGYVIYKAEDIPEVSVADTATLCSSYESLGAHECVFSDADIGMWNITSFSSRLYIGTEMKTKIYIPRDYDASKEYPLLIYLHGLGGESSDISTFRVHDIMKNVLYETGGEVIIAFPQCLPGCTWPHDQNARDVFMEMLGYLEEHMSVDTARVYLTGHSYGAIGSVMLLEDYPGRFAAAVITAGATQFSDYDSIAKTPIRMYCGSEDGYPISSNVEGLYNILKARGADVEYTLVEGLGHSEIFNYAGNDMDLVRWMLSKRAER